MLPAKLAFRPAADAAKEPPAAWNSMLLC